MNRNELEKIGVLFIATIIITSFLTAAFVSSFVTEQTKPNPIMVTIDGKITDPFLNNASVPFAHIMAFADQANWWEQTEYFFSVWDDYSKNDGWYNIEIPVKYDSSAITVVCSKDGYVNIGYATIEITKSDATWQNDAVRRWQTIVDFQMTQFGNFSPPDVNLTRTYLTMTSTVFSNLDYSYQFWNWVKLDPDWMQTLVVIEIGGGHGNDTQVTVKGMIPSRVDVTFFNGTNIAYTSYYPSLHYWTEPEIVTGKL